jgi:hypothetical protein
MGIPGWNFVLYVYHAEPDLFQKTRQHLILPQLVSSESRTQTAFNPSPRIPETGNSGILDLFNTSCSGKSSTAVGLNTW